MAIDYTGMREAYDKYRRSYIEYARKIGEKASEFFGENLNSVVVFGSTVEGRSKPLSDIDVAVILNEPVDEFRRARFRTMINRMLGLNPFEIHVVSSEEWENWYKRFVRKYVTVRPP